ncbi:Rossmann-like domain-containing protein [Kitasatospora sp. NBC_00458]|uniref:Rossmann-like domain-containing protein n=1 Tax=Kitasatospora sp. NBC_00458 TaxID=2903568 RepID=UPI002E195B25
MSAPAPAPGLVPVPGPASAPAPGPGSGTPASTAPAAVAGSAFDLVADRARAGAYGPDPAGLRIALAFTTAQAVRHAGRARGYRNEVLSLRLDAAVGSCAVEPGDLPADTPTDCVGATVAELLDHPLPAVRVAALDAYLGHCRPHAAAPGARPVTLPGGSSLEKSRARAAAVVRLLPLAEVRRVLVVGVVNSLLEQLRSRGVGYLPCDLKGGATEWGEPVHADATARLDDCDAILASGMTLGNGTLDPLLAHARATGKPLVLFAQTGSAVLPRLIGDGVTAVSAEPYPFFWLDGGPTVLHLYGGGAR